MLTNQNSAFQLKIEFLEMIGHIRERQPEHQFEAETNGTRIPSPAFHEAVDQYHPGIWPEG